MTGTRVTTGPGRSILPDALLAQMLLFRLGSATAEPGRPYHPRLFRRQQAPERLSPRIAGQ